MGHICINVTTSPNRDSIHDVQNDAGLVLLKECHAIYVLSHIIVPTKIYIYLFLQYCDQVI